MDKQSNTEETFLMCIEWESGRKGSVSSKEEAAGLPC